MLVERHIFVIVVNTAVIKGPIKGMDTPGEPPADPSKLNNLLISDPLWVYEALGNILTSMVSSSHFAKQPVALGMTIFGSHVLPHVTNNVDS